MDRISKLGYTQRQQAMNLASLYYWGKQYADLKPWDTSGVPLRDKAPSVQVGLTKKAVNKVRAHLFGEGKKPIWKIETSEGTPAEALEIEMNAILREVRLEGRLPEIGRLGALHGTVAVAFYLFEDRMDFDVLHASGAEPIFGRDDRRAAVEQGIDFDDLLELTEYWWSVTEEADGEREFWHKRIFTTQETIEHVPVPGQETDDPRSAEWVRDEERSIVHGLGFVPAEWIRPIEVAHDVDGAPVVTEAEFKLEDEINYTLAQTGRGIRYNQEPTLAFVNVSGRADSVKRGGDNSIQISGAADGGAADAKLLEMNGAGATVAMDYVRLLRGLFNEIVQTVDHDPEQFAGALSGVALERLMYPLVMLVQNLRPEYEYKLGRLIKKMMRAKGTEGDYQVTAQWPSVVESTAADLQQYVLAIHQLYVEGIIGRKKAVEVLAPFLNIDDVDRYLAELDLELAALGTMEDGDEESGEEDEF